MKDQGFKTATYFNKVTKESYELGGIRDISHAWKMSSFVCSRNNWNEDMFSEDVKITVS